jgi:hypothetical protein
LNLAVSIRYTAFVDHHLFWAHLKLSAFAKDFTDINMPRSFAFSNTFEALPVEVICQVLENLEMHDLLACSTVRQRRVSSHTAYIQSE